MGFLARLADDVPANLPPRARTAAQWFFIIAALSVLNSAIMLADGGIVMVVGLGITLVAAAMLAKVGAAAGLIVMAVTLPIAGLFALIGYRARQGHRWAFVLGMTLYGVDALWFVLFGDWFSLGFHAVALVSMFVGYRSLKGWSPAPAVVPEAAASYGVEASEGREADSA